MILICWILGHKWSKWKYTRTVGRYDERLDRDCLRCKKHEFYTGVVEYDRKGDKIPRI